MSLLSGTGSASTAAHTSNQDPNQYDEIAAQSHYRVVFARGTVAKDDESNICSASVSAVEPGPEDRPRQDLPKAEAQAAVPGVHGRRRRRRERLPSNQSRVRLRKSGQHRDGLRCDELQFDSQNVELTN